MTDWSRDHNRARLDASIAFNYRQGDGTWARRHSEALTRQNEVFNRGRRERQENAPESVGLRSAVRARPLFQKGDRVLWGSSEYVVEGIDVVWHHTNSDHLTIYYSVRSARTGQITQATDWMLCPSVPDSDRHATTGDEIAVTLRRAGFENVSVEGSNVSGSPFKYVYVYFTPSGAEGKHALVSEAREFEDVDGYYVSVSENLEDFQDNGSPELVESLNEVPQAIRRLMSPNRRR